MSKIEVDTIDTQSSTTLQVGSTNTSLIKIGTSGDTVEYPAGTTFTQSGAQNVTAGGAITVKSGGNITIDSGATITNNGTATGFSADLTNLNATNLTSGTVPNARFPATLPIANGSALTNLNATNLGSGTIPDARFPAALPAISGANLTNLPASGGGGKVLQVVTDTLTSEYTTGSTSFNDTGLTLNITPAATSSKILIIAHLGGIYSNTSANKFIFTCLRGSTNLGDSTWGFGFMAGFTDGRALNGDGFTFLDSPSTTSATTYKVQARLENATGAGQISQNTATATLTCLEIGA